MRITPEHVVVTQNSLRNEKNVKAIIVARLMGEDVEPAKLYQMPDNQFLIHDGHHRLTADYIMNKMSEANLQPFSYDKFEQINHDVGWVTPHNVMTHVRHGDLYYWKNYVERRKKMLSKIDLNQEIYDSLEEYAEPRKVWSVKDFVKNSEYLQDLFLTFWR